MDNRLLDKLRKLGEAQGNAMGLRSMANADQTPEILMVGMAPKAADVPEGTCDAVLVETLKGAPPKPPKGRPQTVWGCLANGDADAPRKIAEAEADFALVRQADAPATLLGMRDTVCGYWLPAKLSAARIKSIEAANFAFLVFDAKQDLNALSMEEVLLWGETLAEFTHHIFLSCATLPGPAVLRVLRDLPVSGLLIDAPKHAKQLAKLRKDILALEPRHDRTPLKLN